MKLFWHRRGLRTADNVGLADAAARARSADDVVTPVYVLDDDVLEHASDVRVRFLLDALAELRDDYRARDSDLVVARGDPSRVLPELGSVLDADTVVWNRDYSGLARERDDRVAVALSEAGMGRERRHDAVLHEPESIYTNAGEPYSVYTYYWKKWRDREKPEPAPEPTADDLADPALLEAAEEGPDRRTVGDLPTIEELGFREPSADLPAAGTTAARARLEEFLSGDVFRYAEAREYPARDGTSRLSQDLTFGTVGIREVWESTAVAAEAAPDRPEGDAADGVGAFRSQLAWREFYTQVLYHHPELVTENFKAYENPIEWREDPEGLAAWKRGETGYPIVDAGMRQLRTEAHVHNRVRMIVASFLTKDLLIDWREGYAHFREWLLDHDTANDSGGWQWAASTGTDAQPYFRVFNPMTQGERYDPDAEYIRAHVPELRGVEPESIHGWHELDSGDRHEIAPDYPDPIVEHSRRREDAIATFEAARGDD